MPELPEVQTVVDDLNRSVKDCQIVDFSSSWKKNVQKGDFKVFKKNIIGRKILRVARKGKFILFALEPKDFIVAHLRMTGALILDNFSNSIVAGGKNYFEKPEKHIRHSWDLIKDGDSFKVLFSDVRKFGTVDFVEGRNFSVHSGLNRLGTDPMEDDFSLKKLEAIIHGHSKKFVRQLLLDQKVIAGIGNIYASEILFDARIHPSRQCDSLVNSEIKRLHGSIRKILTSAIEHRGTSISDYRDFSGEKGGFQKLLKVYNREHKRCLRRQCAGFIQKAKMQGRSAFWCPYCQVLVKNKNNK